MTKMTPKERALYDAQADHEAWSLAHEILEPRPRDPGAVGAGGPAHRKRGADAGDGEGVGRGRAGG